MERHRASSDPRSPGWRQCLLPLLAGLAMTACGRDPGPAATAQSAPAADPTLSAPADTDAVKRRAHAALARRLRPFLIQRVPLQRSPAAPGGVPLSSMADDDERLRLGAFWKARTDTHHFDADFQARAQAVLALPGDGSAAADATLRQLLETVDRRLPAWQALVDYNASGRMRGDGGEGGRALLPGCIAAIDAIEAAVWAYVETAIDRTPDPA